MCTLHLIAIKVHRASLASDFSSDIVYEQTLQATSSNVTTDLNEECPLSQNTEMQDELLNVIPLN